ncbi:MAG: MauE/DoxX family redox-associated membrane protein [Candidatus Nanopelagicales bacterium]
MNLEVRTWIGTLLRVALAGILFYAAVPKLFEADGARSVIIAYRLVPESLVPALSWGLPVLELVLGALLLVGLFTRWAALVTALLMLGFMLGVVSVWVRGYSIECGCFGGGGDVSEDGKNLRYAGYLLRDFLFVGMATWLVAWPRTKFSLDREPVEGPAYDDDDDELVDADRMA